MERTFTADEIKVLIFVAKATLKSEFRFVEPNELHRKVVAIAQQIGVEPEIIRGVMIPLLREVFEEMITPLPDKSQRRHSRHGKGIPGPVFTKGQPG
jgi:hypothetical protein